jgi:hypothetical protein
MTEENPSGDTGHLRPDRELTDMFRGVVRDMAEQEHGAVKAGVNSALLEYLVNNAPDDVVQYHLSRSDYDSLEELEYAVRDRQNQPFPDDHGGGDGD